MTFMSAQYSSRKMFYSLILYCRCIDLTLYVNTVMFCFTLLRSACVDLMEPAPRDILCSKFPRFKLCGCNDKVLWISCDNCSYKFIYVEIIYSASKFWMIESGSFIDSKELIASCYSLYWLSIWARFPYTYEYSLNKLTKCYIYSFLLLIKYIG